MRKLLPLILPLALLLSGCGFHLRGAVSGNLPADISPLQIQGLGRNDPTRRQLEELLRQTGAILTDDPTQAATTLRLRDRESDRRLLAIDNNGKAIEYELYESLRFDLVDAAGALRVAEQRVQITRSHLNPQEQVLGKQQEEAILRAELRRDLAGQIVNRLAAQLR